MSWGFLRRDTLPCRKAFRFYKPKSRGGVFPHQGVSPSVGKPLGDAGMRFAFLIGAAMSLLFARRQERQMPVTRKPWDICHGHNMGAAVTGWNRTATAILAYGLSRIPL